MATDYGIPNYTINPNPAHHIDLGFTEEGQREVYEFCSDFMKGRNLESVIDVGCGSGYKLIKYLGSFQTIGIETEPCYTALLSNYPHREWKLSGEAEKSFAHTANKTNVDPDVVICSDVIEHIVDPDVLVDYLLTLNAAYYIISTPCRFVLCHHPRFAAQNRPNSGPPNNPCHVREWTMDEFKTYIGQKFQIIESHYCKDQIECQFHLLVRK